MFKLLKWASFRLTSDKQRTSDLQKVICPKGQHFSFKNTERPRWMIGIQNWFAAASFFETRIQSCVTLSNSVSMNIHSRKDRKVSLHYSQTFSSECKTTLRALYLVIFCGCLKDAHPDSFWTQPSRIYLFVHYRPYPNTAYLRKSYSE